MDSLGHGLTESGPFRIIPGFWGAPEGRVAQGAKQVRKALEPAEHECQQSRTASFVPKVGFMGVY